MPLTDMKMSKKKAKERFEVDSDDNDRFPHGLSIHLDNDSLKKLGFDSVPDIGEEFIVVGVGPIVHASEHKRQNGTDRDVTIQLQKIEVGPVDVEDGDSLAAAIDSAIDDANTDHGKDS